MCFDSVFIESLIFDILYDGQVGHHEVKRDIKPSRKMFYISLLASDANEPSGKGYPRGDHYVYDVKARLLMQQYGIQFLTTRDLKEYYKDRSSKYDMPEDSLGSTGIAVYRLAQKFISDHQTDCFFIANVPLIRDGK